MTGDSGPETRMPTLLPQVRDARDFDRLRSVERVWHPALAEIAKRHSLDGPRSLYPTGSAVVFAVGTDYVGVHLHQTEKLIILDVFDQGAGIPKGQLRRIFERFYRVRNKETQRQRGSGIGLSLVQHIVEGHGGTIVVTSTSGVQTRFSIRIPVSSRSK